MTRPGVFALDKGNRRFFTLNGLVHIKIALLVIIFIMTFFEVLEFVFYIFSDEVAEQADWGALFVTMVQVFVIVCMVISLLTEKSLFLVPYILSMFLALTTLGIATFKNRGTFLEREKFFCIALAFLAAITTVFAWGLHIGLVCYQYFESRTNERKTRESAQNANKRPPLVLPEMADQRTRESPNMVPNSIVNKNFSLSDDEDDDVFEKKNGPELTTAQSQRIRLTRIVGVVRRAALSPYFHVERDVRRMSHDDAAKYLVLVTGASGFIGSHCVQQLIEKGYKVRGTVRSLSNKQKVDPIKQLDTKGLLELVEADLLKESSWKSAVDGCDFVLHVASPFPIVADEKCITTAINGTLNVLRAVAGNRNVKKVVLTSSCAAVNEGHSADKVFDETSWTNVDDPRVDCYAKSKTLAEKAAWDFMKEAPRSFSLTTINPTLVFGPAYITEQGSSISLMRRFMSAEMPACPPLNLATVDVRDVTLAHINAMRIPESDGQRILVTNIPSVWFLDIGRTLNQEFKGQGYWIPRIQAPYIIVWLFSFFDKEAAATLPRLCQKVKFDNTKMKTLLGITPRDTHQAFIDMAHSLIKLGIVRKPRIRCIF
ncbi:unnamed protein product [Caenorhabditis auriculariae]|uniref:NAD-dependent epimerase/dehydratase domain-containing protein n=1 Tax=Caenorhabditis auriculariae TaxID=2777116 RepID=A0A8S1HEN0_9PELO|nr:unnamed protein product [Caenorhabditis auriculariae]